MPCIPACLVNQDTNHLYSGLPLWGCIQHTDITQRWQAPIRWSPWKAGEDINCLLGTATFWIPKVFYPVDSRIVHTMRGWRAWTTKALPSHLRSRQGPCTMSPQATRFTGIENQGCNVNLESEFLSNTEGDSGGMAYCLAHGKISVTGMGGWIDIVSIFCNSYYIHLCPKEHLYPPNFQPLGSSPIFFLISIARPKTGLSVFFHGGGCGNSTYQKGCHVSRWHASLVG